MNSMNKLPVAVFLLAAIAIAPVFNQPKFNPFGNGGPPVPLPPNFPIPGNNPGKPKFPSLPVPPGLLPRIPRFCDLTVPKVFKDNSIVKMVDVPEPGAASPSASPTRSSDVQRAISKQKSGPDQGVVEGFLAAARNIATSKAKAALARSAGRAKRQVPVDAYLSPTKKTSMCTSVPKQIVTVKIGAELCDTIAPQEVLHWDCGSRFCKVSNSNPLLERYYCEAGNRVWTSWYVYCRRSQEIKIHSAEIAINCCCNKYSCDFTPYHAESPMKF